MMDNNILTIKPFLQSYMSKRKNTKGHANCAVKYRTSKGFKPIRDSGKINFHKGISSEDSIQIDEIKTHDKILIVADGPSAKEILENAYYKTIPENIYVIGVNRVITWLPIVNAYFTLDPDMTQYVIMRKKKDNVEYFCAVPKDYGTIKAKSPNHRVPKLLHVHYLHRVANPNHVVSNNADVCFGINTNDGYINTGNSSWGALNLACHMKAEKVVLLGVDGNNTKNPKVSGGYSRSLSHLTELFKTYDGNANVVNASINSVVNNFRKMNIKDAIKWLSL